MAAQSIQQQADWPPLVCICSLCECGGHKCSDFNEWLTGARQNGNDTAEVGQHTCSYTRAAALDERYLNAASRSSSSSNAAAAGIARPNHAEAAPVSAHDDTAHEPLKEAKTRSVTPAGADARHETRDNNDDDEVLRVLVTRPQVASRPRDNILFEGDMDLRTTFETSYEALALARLEHWKRHQAAAEAQRQQDVSDKPTDRQTAAAAAKGSAIRHSRSRQLEGDTAPADDVEKGPAGGSRSHSRPHSHARGFELDTTSPTSETNVQSGGFAPDNQQLTRARRAVDADLANESKQPQQQQQSRPLVSGQALSLEARSPHGLGRTSAGPAPPSPQPMQADQQQQQLTSEQRRLHQRRRQQDHFIDPDLSPIIVYDANLNRLERVGLRKRSKYRPSTSLRPGGRGFFGPAEGGNGASDYYSTDGTERTPAEQVALGALQQTSPAADELMISGGSPLVDRGREKRCVQQLAGASERTGRAEAAGASSETLNRDRNDCGRKHNHAHVNRIDHIKQMNLVESSQPEKQFADTATSFDGGEGIVGSLAKPSSTVVLDKGVGGGDAEDAHQRQLALEEEAAAVAEIRRLVVNNEDEYRVAHRVEPVQQQQPQKSSSSLRQSTDQRLGKQTTIASPSEAIQTGLRTQNNSPISIQGASRSTRHSRMERVCQNQSFYLFENDYPETRAGALDEKRCIKIGGRETVELSRQMLNSPSGGLVRQNLFRESPDFIMTTGHTQGRLSQVEAIQPVRQHRVSGTATVNVQATDTRAVDNDEDLKHDAERIIDHGAINGSHKCRVLNLGDEFEFVGSRLGHNYFVERHLETTPISELG